MIVFCGFFFFFFGGGGGFMGCRTGLVFIAFMRRRT